MAIEKRLLRVRATNDKILQAFLRINNDQDDGIYFEEIDRATGQVLTSGQQVTAGQPVTGANIIPRSQVFPGEDVRGIILDTNHLENPSGYIISLCFYTDDGTNSKLYMGRVSGGSTPSWVACADSPKEYPEKIITGVFSAFLNTQPPSPIKIVNRRSTTTTRDEDVIIERH